MKNDEFFDEKILDMMNQVEAAKEVRLQQKRVAY